jgi:tetratricopeptide (TPR) repeat protein
MSVIHSKTLYRHLAIVVLVSICASCQVADQPVDNPYQRPVENSSTDNDGSQQSSTDNEATEQSTPQATPQAVIQLQNQALAAINEDQYSLATDYLQRAVKIQPRNAWSWHYLADIHWRQGQHERCIAMIERSEGYAGADTQLDSENARLREQCQ